MDVINILNNSSSRFQKNVKNKNNEKTNVGNNGINNNSKSKLREMMTPNFLNYIKSFQKTEKNNQNNNNSNDVMNKDDLLDSGSKKLSESKDENYNDLCNNICTKSESINIKEKDENEKLKEQINKEIEDLYQMSLKNSQNKKSNNINKNKQKELIKPMENSNKYFFDEDEFKENNTEFI